MRFNIHASMMCADFGNLSREVRSLEEAGVDYFHIDIMDGRYVPNFAMSINDMKYIARAAKKPLDVHLMLEHPNNNIHMFLEHLKPGDIVYIHPEAEYHPSTTLQKIIDAGIVPGIAINPGTSVESIVELLRIVDKVLVMSVNPGNAGQMFLPYVGTKVNQLLELQKSMHFDLIWDGACTMDKVKTYAPMGMSGFVLGTSLLFGKPKSYKDIIKEIRSLKFE